MDLEFAGLEGHGAGAPARRLARELGHAQQRQRRVRVVLLSRYVEQLPRCDFFSECWTQLEGVLDTGEGVCNTRRHVVQKYRGVRDGVSDTHGECAGHRWGCVQHKIRCVGTRSSGGRGSGARRSTAAICPAAAEVWEGVAFRSWCVRRVQRAGM